jgi:hypothetical protein
VGLLASSVNRSDIHDLFPGRIRKPAPRKAKQAKHYQNDAKRFAHGSPLRQRLYLQRGNPPEAEGFQCSGETCSYLLIQHVFHLTDLLLNFAGQLFGMALGL